MIELSQRTQVLLEKIFPDQGTRNLVARYLADECGDNLSFCENSSPVDMEKIRFSVLKLSAGDLEKVESAVKLAALDWRDLFMAAGFGQDIDAHLAWYEEKIGT